MMRRILVDHARRSQAAKRGGPVVFAARVAELHGTLRSESSVRAERITRKIAQCDAALAKLGVQAAAR